MMLQRHRPFSGAVRHQSGWHGRSSARLGCCTHTHPGRRLLLLAQALDGRAEQIIANSVSSKASPGTVTTSEQEKDQQQLSTTQADMNSSSSSSTSKQDAAAPLTQAAGPAAGASSSSSNQQSQASPPWVPSWESWCAHFEQHDTAGTRLDALAAPLAAAVAAEDYATAAALSSEMNELVAADAVATVQRQLAEALASEDYAAAAALRDQGWALLEGWWACVSSSQNPRGHLLRIYPEYGRWTGKAFSPRDLGELQGWTGGEPGRMFGRSSSSSSNFAKRPGAVISRRRAGAAAALDAEGLAQLGTPLMEVFVRMEEQEGAVGEGGQCRGRDFELAPLQQQQQQWSSQAVLLQPAGTAGAGAGAAARDIGLEAEIRDSFRSAVSQAVWGKPGLDGDTAAAAAASLANNSNSSSNDANMFSSLIRNLNNDCTSPSTAGSGARFELLIGENGQVMGAGSLAAAAAASELEPWEELLNAAEPLLRTAAATADMQGGVLCADGVLRQVRRQQQQGHATPVLQLLLEVVEGSRSVLLAARAVQPGEASGVTHGTSWVVADMPAGPGIVPDWSKIDHREVADRQARIAASLETQRIVRDMLGAQDNWWNTEFMGSWSPPPAAAAALHEEQQQQTADPLDWQLPLQLLQQQQQNAKENLTDQQGDMTLLETTEDDDESWPVLDAVSRAGFYPAFYQDYGPGVDAPAAQPAATAAYAGFEQQASAAMDAAAAAAASGRRFNGMSPAEVEEALETLEELKDASHTSNADSSSNSSSSSNEDRFYSRWLPTDEAGNIHDHQQQQQHHARGSRRHAGNSAVGSSSSSSSNWPPATPAAAFGAAIAASGFGAEFADPGIELERHPAVITLHSRDRFTIKPSQQSNATVSTGLAAAAAATAAREGSSSSSTGPQCSLYVVEVPTCLVQAELAQQQHGTAHPEQQPPPQQGAGFFSHEGHEHSAAASASQSSIQSRGYSRVWQFAAHQLLLQHAYNCSSSSSSDSPPVTWRQPLADLMAARAAEALWGADVVLSTADSSAEGEALHSDWPDHSSSRCSSNSCSLGVDEAAPLLVLQLPPELVDRTLAAIVGSNKAAEAKAAAAAAVQVPRSPVAAAAAAAAAAGTAGVTAALDPQEGLTYMRLHPMQHTTDPLQGLFLGSFGPHGPELLSLSRSICPETGEQLLTGLKLTGDPNVPAGQVSFRARVGRRHRMDARNIYPPQLDVTARYPGEGRVAGPNFTNPRWVEGELLVFNSSSSSSSWTSGAQLGFVYSMPGEKRFLILLNRVALV